MLFTGLLMLLAVASYGLIIRNDPPLQIHFYDDVLIPHFKAPFYLVLFTGLGASILAIAIVIADHIWPRQVAKIFHHSFIEDDIIFQVAIYYLLISKSIVNDWYHHFYRALWMMKTILKENLEL